MAGTDTPQEEESIPTLDEIVSAEEIAHQGGSEHNDGQANLYSEAGLNLLADKIRIRITEDIQEIIDSAVTTAIERSLGEFRSRLRDELDASLESRLGPLISILYTKASGAEPTKGD